MTYSELLEKALAKGLNCADISLARMMDKVEEETGKWPDWEAEVPNWILKNFRIKEEEDEA